MSAGRKKGLKKMPPLSPNTLAMLPGRCEVRDDGKLAVLTGASKSETLFAIAAFPAAIEPRLARLVFDIRMIRSGLEGMSKNEWKKEQQEIVSDYEETFSMISSVAIAVGDDAFFMQVAEAIRHVDKHLEKSRGDQEYPLRVLVLRCLQYFRMKSATVSEMKACLSELTPKEFSDDQIRADLKALGKLKVTT
ncbi:hypothetical protein ACFQY0_01105 [Haloferula chungangensis]|uniref:Uncharacterized protein n=1 Tax=Haloferula chungangensis TaxID=1048331 RepID=A0ABW2L0C5_9BACT